MRDLEIRFDDAKFAMETRYEAFRNNPCAENVVSLMDRIIVYKEVYDTLEDAQIRQEFP